MMHRVYSVCRYLGRIAGCHQRTDRSFFFRGRQFPICARCTGVLVGECVAIILFRWISPTNYLLMIFCGIMLLDWLIQYLGICESTNMRRFVTGNLCGYAYTTLILRSLLRLKQILSAA